MLNRTRVALRPLALLIGPALLMVLGCSDDGMGKRYPVSGTVEYNGKPVAKGSISFTPKAEAAGRGASGPIEDGKFSALTTLNPGDGVMEGEYLVSVTASEIDAGKMSKEADELAAKKGMGKMTMIPPEMLAKANKEAKSSIPKKYEKAATSGLNAKVNASSTSFKFELKD
jgi:hypothetical protein